MTTDSNEQFRLNMENISRYDGAIQSNYYSPNIYPTHYELATCEYCFKEVNKIETEANAGICRNCVMSSL
jgi:hypothetical protein